MSFAATEVEFSAAPAADEKEEGTWPLGPSPAGRTWPFAECEEPAFDFGGQFKLDLVHMFDTDGEKGPLYGSALMFSTVFVVYDNNSNISNLAHVLVDCGASRSWYHVRGIAC